MAGKESSPDSSACAKKEEEEDIAAFRLNPIARVILQGLYDEGSELSRLNGMWYILRKIWRYVTTFWKANIKVTEILDSSERNFEKEVSYLNLQSKGSDGTVSYRERPYLRQTVNFPKPTGIQINMMPFVMAKNDFSKCRLPKYLKGYWENLVRLCPLGFDQIDKIGFLTVHESFVEEHTSQRRPGIHTERPGIVRFNLKEESSEDDEEKTGESCVEGPAYGDGYALVRRYSFGWGNGYWRPVSEQPDLEGGIYMASNVSDSCRIYNCEIMNDALIGELGDIEHLREYLPEGETLKENCIYWLTDRTPHESLPLKTSNNRQFFRLVTSEVSLWYEDHSTKNPLGVVPDPKITKIVKGSKFDKAGVVFVEDDSDSKKNLKQWLKSLFLV